jgi:hypothetical protein
MRLILAHARRGGLKESATDAEHHRLHCPSCDAVVALPERRRRVARLDACAATLYAG